MGLCSYLLIGFWNKDIKNCKAANKAFIVNRVGDIGFLLGMLCLVTVGGAGALNYDLLNQFIQMVIAGGHVELVLPMLTLASVMFFVGCTGKSAQIPLLTWLPDAMAGPTPVSALIHAATMVTSGVYLVARLSNMFVLCPDVLNLILVVGALTAFWAAFAGLFQNDIKKVLAYSTISQLGYMFMAAGVSAFDASIFHVFTHAFFKASLFLGAGAVIHALAGEQDMRRMGGMIKKTPVTACVMIFAFLAIVGFPGFAGFWSKDLILERIFTNCNWVFQRVKDDAQGHGGVLVGALVLQPQLAQGQLHDGGDQEADDEGHQNRQQILPEYHDQRGDDGIEGGVDDEIFFHFHKAGPFCVGPVFLRLFSHL